MYYFAEPQYSHGLEIRRGRMIGVAYVVEHEHARLVYQETDQQSRLADLLQDDH